MKTIEMYIDGKFTLAKSGTTRDIIDPGNGELIAKVPESTKEDAVLAIKAARKAFDEGVWRITSALDRGKHLFKIADLIRANAKMLAELETRNCGKPLAEAVMQPIVLNSTADSLLKFMAKRCWFQQTPIVM